MGSAGYVHGYATPEQERLVEQAEHWRHRLIRAGTRLEPGTRLLEVGCGVGAVLGVLGQEFPGVRLVGVDIEHKQLEFARGHLQRAGVEARLVEADALALPFPDQSFDHVWMMWFLEHVADPPAVLCEARRVLAPGGAVTAIEVDYSTCRAEDLARTVPSLPHQRKRTKRRPASSTRFAISFAVTQAKSAASRRGQEPSGAPSRRRNTLGRAGSPQSPHGSAKHARIWHAVRIVPLRR